MNYLQLMLTGSGKNSRATGAKITFYADGKTQYVEKIPSRGFQSSVSDRIHIGLGKAENVDSIRITWMSGTEIKLRNVKANQILKFPKKIPIQE